MTRRKARAGWISAQTLLVGSLKRLNVPRHKVEEAVLLQSLQQVLLELFPKAADKIKPVSFRDGVLKLVVTDNYLAQEIRMKETEIQKKLEGVERIQFCTRVRE